jgi:NADPH2:quinone reductase
MKAIVVSKHGGPEVLEWRDHEAGDPGPGEVRSGRRRSGSISSMSISAPGFIPRPTACLWCPAMKAAGVVTVSVGEGVTSLGQGDRPDCLCRADRRLCANTGDRSGPKIVKVPDGIGSMSPRA